MVNGGWPDAAFVKIFWFGAASLREQVSHFNVVFVGVRANLGVQFLPMQLAMARTRISGEQLKHMTHSCARSISITSCDASLQPSNAIVFRTPRPCNAPSTTLACTCESSCNSMSRNWMRYTHTGRSQQLSNGERCTRLHRNTRVSHTNTKTTT